MSSAATATGENPIYSPFFGVMGAASAIIFSGKHTTTVVHTRTRLQQQQCTTARANNGVFSIDARFSLSLVTAACGLGTRRFVIGSRCPAVNRRTDGRSIERAGRSKRTARRKTGKDLADATPKPAVSNRVETDGSDGRTSLIVFSFVRSSSTVSAVTTESSRPSSAPLQRAVPACLGVAR